MSSSKEQSQDSPQWLVLCLGACVLTVGSAQRHSKWTEKSLDSGNIGQDPISFPINIMWSPPKGQRRRHRAQCRRQRVRTKVLSRYKQIVAKGRVENILSAQSDHCVALHLQAGFTLFLSLPERSFPVQWLTVPLDWLLRERTMECLCSLLQSLLLDSNLVIF